MVFFSYFNTVFNMVLNTPNINIFNTSWNFDIAFYMHYSFQHMLKFSTCFFTVFRTFWNFNMLFYSFQNILKFQHAFLQFSEHTEIFNMLFYSFQNILKFQYAFFTVFRTYWNFQHAFSQFSEHAEIFNMLFLSFKHSFSICLQHALQISTCSEIFNTLQTWKFKTFTVKFYFYVVQIYVNQGSYKLSMTDHYGGQVNNWPHSHTPQISM